MAVADVVDAAGLCVLLRGEYGPGAVLDVDQVEPFLRVPHDRLAGSHGLLAEQAPKRPRNRGSRKSGFEHFSLAPGFSGL